MAIKLVIVQNAVQRGHLLEKDIDTVGERGFTEEQINQWFARANEIEADEPAPHQILLNRCHKRAIKALGSPDDIKLSWFTAWIPSVFLPFIP